MKKVFAVLIVFAAIVFSSGTRADAADIIASGYCGGEGDGTNLAWTVDSDGVLVVKGSGSMAEYSSTGAPWFLSWYDVKSVIVEDGVTSIGNYAFSEGFRLPEKKRLLSAQIAGSVTSIGDFAFYGCTKLTSLTIGSKITTIGRYAFANCGFPSIELPRTVTSIGDSAFQSSGLKSVVLPDSITRISNYMFSGCGMLTGITIPDSVTSIGLYAFENCTSLTDVVIPDSVRSIANSAFYGCTGLTSVTIGKGVAKIDNNAFSHCSALKTVSIPDNVTTLGIGAFYWCTGLKSVDIGAGVKIIGGNAFDRCTDLQIVALRNTVTGIGRNAFRECGSLAEVCYCGSESNWDALSIGEGNDALNAADKHIGGDWAFTGFDWSMSGKGKVYADFRCGKCGRTGKLPAGVAASGTTLTAVVTGPDGEVYNDSKQLPTSMTYSATVTMNENFNLNLYVKDLPADFAPWFTVKWTFDGESFEQDLGELTPQTGGQYPGSYKVMLANVFSYEMTKPFVIKIYREGTEGPVKEISYSVQQYFENQYNKTSDALFKEIYGAALDYGAAAQLYFSSQPDPSTGAAYDTDVGSLANKTTNPAFDIYADKPSNKAAKSGSITGMDDRMTATLIFGSETSIKIYFKYSGDINGLTITADNGKVVTAPELGSDGRYSVKIEGIRSFELYKNFTFTFTAGGETRTVTYSAYTYAANKWNSDDADLARLVKALVAYGELARQKWQ